MPAGLDENDFRYGYGNYFKSAFLKVTDISCFQSSQQLRGTLTTAFERHLTIEDFTGMDQHTCQFLLA